MTTVVAAVIERDDRFLVTRRVDGVHLAGMFPCLPGQSGYGKRLRRMGGLLAAVITELARQCEVLKGEVEAGFGRHPDAEIYRSQPGIGAVLGARVLGEFGDDRCRYASAKARRNYAGTSPITRASGKKKIVAAR